LAACEGINSHHEVVNRCDENVISCLFVHLDGNVTIPYIGNVTTIRGATDMAFTPAEKQSRYRARQRARIAALEQLVIANHEDRTSDFGRDLGQGVTLLSAIQRLEDHVWSLENEAERLVAIATEANDIYAEDYVERTDQETDRLKESLVQLVWAVNCLDSQAHQIVLQCDLDKAVRDELGF
jgi:hypothetical protein